MTRTIFIAAALALVATLPAVPAQATGAPRTFLSAAGSDANSCTNVTTPCRHLATAFAATAQDGEIYVLDPANYGSLTITHGVSIEGHGWASIAPVANGNAITITAAPGDRINIIGVVLDGTAVTNTNGIVFDFGGSLTVRDSVIRNFTRYGILFEGNTTFPGKLYVSNTLVSDNGADGIDIAPSGSGTVTAALNHVELVNSGLAGLDVANIDQAINVTVSDSVSENNGSDGIRAGSNGGPGVSVMVRNSTIANNTTGLDAEGPSCSGGAGGSPSATIFITRSTITGNSGNAWSQSATCGFVISYSDNNIDRNGNDTTPPNSLPYK